MREVYVEQLTNYVRQTLAVEFDPREDLLIDVLDSVGLLQLILFIEEELGIVLDIATLSLEIFASVDALSIALLEFSSAAHS